MRPAAHVGRFFCMKKNLPTIKKRRLDELKPYLTNARTHTADQVAQIAASIEEFGWTNPVLIDGKNGVIAGHGRLLAAEKLGIKEVPCIELDHLTETQRQAYILADNRLAELAGWDENLLRLELGELDSAGFDLDLIGFGDFDFGLDPPEVPEPQTDRAEELREEWGVKTGQVWQVGRHRVMCGDSTSAEDVAALLGGAVPDAVITDPPYGMSAVQSSGVLSEKYSPVIGDENTNVAGLAVDVASMFDGAHQIWWGANYYIDALGPSAAWLVWDKNNGSSDQMDAELAWTNLSGVTRKFTMTVERGGDRCHPTQKPADLAAWCIDRCGAETKTFLDLFIGAGWTAVAAEQLGRACYGMEIEPKYVAVTLQRLADMGLKPELVDGSEV